MGIDHSNPYIHSTTVLCDCVANIHSLLLAVTLAWKFICTLPAVRIHRYPAMSIIAGNLFLQSRVYMYHFLCFVVRMCRFQNERMRMTLYAQNAA